MIDLVIPLIEINCVRFPYVLNEDGTRKIDSEKPFEERFQFRFDLSSLEKIIFRDGPRTIIVDNKTINFQYYSGVVLENDEYIWIVKGKDTFLEQCKDAYIKQKMIEKFAMMIHAVPEYKNSTDDKIYTEFE